MGKISLASGRIYVERAGDVVFDTGARSACLFPDGTKLTGTRNVVFSDLLKGNAYYNAQLPGDPGVTAWSYITYLKQEWGPQYSFDATNNLRNFADVLIGAVPSETDYLDVMVRVNRTVAPDDDIDGQPFYTIYPENRWFKADGGCCVVEHDNLVARMFEFALIGSNVYLRRYQSVGNASPPTNAGNTGSLPGFTIGSVSNNEGNAATLLDCVVGGVIETRGYNPLGFNRNRAGNNDRPDIPGRAHVIPGSSSTSGTYSDISDFSSTYSVEYIVHPGRINN